jgi:hypothetical protein
MDWERGDPTPEQGTYEHTNVRSDREAIGVSRTKLKSCLSSDDALDKQDERVDCISVFISAMPPHCPTSCSSAEPVYTHPNPFSTNNFH